MNRPLSVLLIAIVPLASCGEPPTKTVSEPTVAASPVAAPHGLSPVRIARGAELYKQNCAVCHGARGEGAPNWQRPGADGRYPAPPLDGSGHAWHHPSAALEQTIRGGTIKLGGSMPAWGGKLSESEIKAVIAWFQSLWPDEIYSAWLNMEMRVKK